jgi:hypothetical protein
MAHFAVLRRPPTSAERAARSKFVVGIGTGARNEYPTFLRLLGRAAGVPVYLVVYADFRNGATGSVTSYSMEIAATSGINYVKGNYTIFPDLAGDPGRPSAYFSVIPDGIRKVRWQLACPSLSRGCLLADGQHTVSIPVKGNLAVLPLRMLNPGTSYASAVRVTWNHEDGSRTTFTNPYAAVPFPGAPAENISPAPQKYSPGNGPPSGEPLRYWQSLYGVLRRPQNPLDRSANAVVHDATTSPVVPQFTRVVLSTDNTLVFITLSAVNPSVGSADRRYVAAVDHVVQNNSPSGSADSLTPGAQPPNTAIPGTGLLDYSVVPDNVTKVQWTIRCLSGCTHGSSRTIRLQPHDNVVYSKALEQGSTSSELVHVVWYRGGRAERYKLGP